MTTNARNLGLAMTAGMTLLLLLALLFTVEFDRAGLSGIAIGAGLGLANLVIGYKIALRSLHKGLTSLMAAMMGGAVRQDDRSRSPCCSGSTGLTAVDEIAFGITFMAFFFAYLGVLVVLVERVLGGNGSTA